MSKAYRAIRRKHLEESLSKNLAVLSLAVLLGLAKIGFWATVLIAAVKVAYGWFGGV